MSSFLGSGRGGIVTTTDTIVQIAATSPTNNNDEDDTASIGTEFKTGDMWLNSLTNQLWICTDPSSGSAVWVKTSKSVWGR